jgi:hypothetical protein
MEWHENQPFSGIAGSSTVTAPAVTNAALDPRHGSITGTVTDDATLTAVSGAWVVAIGPNGIAGGGVTGPAGAYAVSGLPAGNYRVAFVDPLGGRTQEYHANSPDFAGATPVTVTGGGTTTVDAALHHP